MTDYSHAALGPTHDGDVCYEPEPTAAQMVRHSRDARYAESNIVRALGDGPMTAFAMREAMAHSEHTIARAVRALSDSNRIARYGRRWALTN